MFCIVFENLDEPDFEQYGTRIEIIERLAEKEEEQVFYAKDRKDETRFFYRKNSWPRYEWKENTIGLEKLFKIFIENTPGISVYWTEEIVRHVYFCNDTEDWIFLGDDKVIGPYKTILATKI